MQQGEKSNACAAARMRERFGCSRSLPGMRVVCVRRRPGCCGTGNPRVWLRQPSSRASRRAGFSRPFHPSWHAASTRSTCTRQADDRCGTLPGLPSSTRGSPEGACTATSHAASGCRDKVEAPCPSCSRWPRSPSGLPSRPSCRARPSTWPVASAAGQVLRSHGLEVRHDTGHGIGLEVHEAPWIAEDSPDTIEAGMLVCLEPGAYHPARGGTRREERVLVTDRGGVVPGSVAADACPLV